MIFICILLSLVIFWVLYLAAMNLLRAKAEGKLTIASYIMGTPIVLIGALIDLFFNATIFSIVFIEPPRELMLTKRLKRHIQHGVGWRKSLAFWVCRNLLNPFDHTGDHCD